MKPQPLHILLPDRCDVFLDRYQSGNEKLGPGVYSYSRVAGYEGSCPGSTQECEAICYAKRITGVVRTVYSANSNRDDVPPIPDECRVLRIHVSGDFDTPGYILAWRARLAERPDVTAWAYTRSWRCHSLLEFLEELRALPNMQLFASMDASTWELPPSGWRRAWVWRDASKNGWPVELRLGSTFGYEDFDGRVGTAVHNLTTGNTPAYVCPEETGRKPDCVSCGYCFEGQKHDVVFLEH